MRLDYAVHDDNERSRRPADLSTRAAQNSDHKTGEDRCVEPLFRLNAGGDREGDRKWKGDHPDG